MAGEIIAVDREGKYIINMLEASTSLTIALDKGNHSYLLSVGRIGEVASANWAYHQHDALGSVRQLTDEGGTVTLSKSYMPYGDKLSSNGAGASSYGFSGEWVDVSGLIFLRARYYAPAVGRFLTRDAWDGSLKQPISFNKWLYVHANPVNLTDPSGFDPWWCENQEHYPTDAAKRQCYDDWLAGNGYGLTSSEVNLVLLCGTDMWGACQGNYGDPNGSYKHGYKGVQPLTPAKNWAINKGYTFQYYGTKKINPESKAVIIAGGMAARTEKYGTKHIIIGFSGGASFSTLVALRATDVFDSDDILLVVQLDSEIKPNEPGNTNTEDNLDALKDLGLEPYGCNSKEYLRYYILNTLSVGHFGIPRPEYSVYLPGVKTHKELAVRQDIFDTYIKPRLEAAVNGIH